MDLIIEVLSGERLGGRFPIRAGMLIGRHNADLTINDSKISGHHAKVVQLKDSGLWLIDLGSSNGIRVGNKKIRRLRLLPDVEFRLGKTRFKVGAGEKSDVAGPAAMKMSDAPGSARPWQNVLRGLIERGLEKSRAKPREVAPFVGLLHLQIRRGPQSGQRWTLGYGPREVGRDSIDLALEDRSLPSKCIQLTPQSKGPLMKVHESALEIVKLNQGKVDVAYLKSGDMIEIGTTQIEVIIEKILP